MLVAHFLTFTRPWSPSRKDPSPYLSRWHVFKNQMMVESMCQHGVRTTTITRFINVRRTLRSPSFIFPNENRKNATHAFEARAPLPNGLIWVSTPLTITGSTITLTYSSTTYPNNVTLTLFLASEAAWYCIRGLLPMGPRTTMQTCLMISRSVSLTKEEVSSSIFFSLELFTWWFVTLMLTLNS